MARFSGAYGTGWASWALGAAIAAVVALAWYRTPGPEAPETGADRPEMAATEPARASGSPAGPEDVSAEQDGEAQPATDAGDEAVAQDAPSPQPEPDTLPPADEPAPALPSIDLARVDDTGMVVVAGRAAPGSRVTVLLNGRAGDVQEVDAGGAFASIIAMEPGDDPVVLTLSAETNGAVAASEDQVILAPRPDRPQIADAGQDIAVEAEAVAQPTPAEAAVVAKADNMANAAQTPDLPQAPTVPAESAAEAPESSGSVAVLRASREGVELLSPSTNAPAAPDQVALDTIGYTDRGEVLLNGRAGADSSVRVYLDNKLVAELGADEAGRWKGRLPDVPPGVYALRLDELGDGGGVASRLETPFQREAPEVLARPGIQSPGSAVLREVTVQQGDTLWAISRERYGDGFFYVRVFEANREAIRNPDLIYPGQVFALPDDPTQRQE